MDWAVELARRIHEDLGKEVPVFELSSGNLEMVLEKTDILINATSVGMSPNSEESPVPAQLLKSDLVVFDIVYNPIRTKLLKKPKPPEPGLEAVSTCSPGRVLWLLRNGSDSRPHST